MTPRNGKSPPFRRGPMLRADGQNVGTSAASPDLSTPGRSVGAASGHNPHVYAGVLRKIRGRVTGNLRKSLTATVALPRRPRPHPHGVLGGWAGNGGDKNDPPPGVADFCLRHWQVSPQRGGLGPGTLEIERKGGQVASWLPSPRAGDPEIPGWARGGARRFFQKSCNIRPTFSLVQ
jgi:hypothetical protein